MTSSPDRSTVARRRRLSSIAAPLVAFVAVIGIALLGISDDGESGDGALKTGTSSDGEPTDLARRQADDPLALGSPDAPVVMVEYSDFQCHFCARWVRETEPELIERYVDKGVLRIEWRDFPYLGEESLTASLAARAAGRQDRFWDYRNALYADDPKMNSGRLSEDYLIGLAASLGLDAARFEKDMKDPAVYAEVEADAKEGQAIGVTGTPAFVINGKPIVGAQPTEVFVEAIEDAAAAAEQSGGGTG